MKTAVHFSSASEEWATPIDDLCHGNPENTLCGGSYCHEKPDRVIELSKLYLEVALNLEAELERLRAANRWIPVSEGHPPINAIGFSEEVLCWDGKKMFMWGCYQRGDMMPVWSHPASEITHWRKVGPPEERK